MNPESPSLYSVVLLISPEREVWVDATMGHRAHAAFLNAIRQADPHLSAALHDPQVSIRPFTVSPMGGIAPRGETIHLRPDQTYWLRVTLLVRPLYERLMEALMSNCRPRLRLGEATVLIREVLVTPGSHPWAGYASWEELAAQARPERELTLDFVSPTAFSFGGGPGGRRMIVLPIPDLVFGSLARTWNAYAPPPLQVEPKALEHYAAEYTIVREIAGLRTRMLNFSGRPQIGFVGQVTYGLIGENNIARFQMSMLASFAFYGGVGYKRTMGMGQCRALRGRSEG